MFFIVLWVEICILILYVTIDSMSIKVKRLCIMNAFLDEMFHLGRTINFSESAPTSLWACK